MTKLVNGVEVELGPKDILELEQRNVDHLAKLILATANKYKQDREAEYLARGITIEALTVALVESIVEGRPQALNALQALREEVKSLYPKPGA